MRCFLICAVLIGANIWLSESLAGPRGQGILDGRFDLDGSGFVKNWLILEPETKAHFGGRTESGAMPDWEIAEWKAVYPEKIALSSSGPWGMPWRYKQTLGDIFMQHHADAPIPSSARMYAAVDLESPEKMKVEARLWVGGWADIWLNGKHLGKYHRNGEELDLKLRAGRNRLVAYLQNGGLRGIHFRLGLQILEDAEKIGILLPGPERATADMVQGESWLSNLKVEGRDRLVAEVPPPFPVKVETGWRDRNDADWPMGQIQFTLPDDDVYMFRIEMDVHGQELRRQFEIANNFKMVQPDPSRPLADHRRDYLERMADGGGRWHNYFAQAIARRMLGRSPVYNAEALERALRRINQRHDCADFDMAFALRLIRLGAGTQHDRRRIKESALAFKYWRDEPGEDGMCYHSENHRLLFHSAQLIAGNLWPEQIFTNTGNTGRQQAELGKQRCLEWLDELEVQGYHEFLSTTYVPITVGAVMNLVDFSDDAQISRRASRQMDKIYRMLAEHSFDGIMCGPQGRSYRYILYPQVLGTQSLLSYATPLAVESTRSWTVFVASSPKYRPPAQIESLMQTPLRKTYKESYYLIDLNKTADYMLSSLEIPMSGKEATFEGGLKPGGKGYQQHIWHATLAKDCHVFTNHPGASRDLTGNRPSFWAGTYYMPRQTQRGNILLQIFNIPEKHSIQFTHAHWPSDVFDRQELRGHWAYGQKKDGYIGLWCSTRSELSSEVLIDRELRAWGNKMAWVCVCSSKHESGDFESFIRSCEGLQPQFHPGKLRLELKGQDPLEWDTD
ncbi:MAG: hypothetical protein ACYTF1_08900 [Planctomycetota bacterium]|jgi:hypothetical protein